MRCLVTGGAGFIGSHLVEALLARGEEVRVLDDLSSGRAENLAAVWDKIEFRKGDIRDPEACAKAAEGAAVVFHLAALPSVPRSVEDPVGSLSVNDLGTATVLSAATQANVRRVVYSSSSAVYGDTPELPKRERMDPKPLSPYAAGKLAGEYACRAFRAVMGVESACLRYFNVYGPRQSGASAYAAAIPAFFSRLLSSRSPLVYGDGRQTRDFTYVSDVVEANLLAASGSVADGSALNVAAGERTSILELLSVQQRLCGKDLAPQFLPERPGDVRDSWADISLAREKLGYEPKVSLEEGLERTLRSVTGQ